MKEQQFYLVCTMLLCFSLSLFVGLAVWTDRSLDYTASEIRGEDINVPWYLSAAVTLVAPAIIPFNIGCEIYREAFDDTP
jgi:hypothetical protein